MSVATKPTKDFQSLGICNISIINERLVDVRLCTPILSSLSMGVSGWSVFSKGFVIARVKVLDKRYGHIYQTKVSYWNGSSLLDPLLTSSSCGSRKPVKKIEETKWE